MIFMLILGLFILAIIISHRQYSIAIFIAIAMAKIAHLISNDLALTMVNFGIKQNQTWLASFIFCLLVVIPAIIIVYRSHKRSRSILKIIFESNLFVSVLILMTYTNLINLTKIDQFSVDIYNFLASYSKIFLSVAGVYAFWQLIIKDEE